jgi:urease alpha subunit
MLHHRDSATVSVDPDGAGVSLDGERLHMDPVESVPLSRLYFL